MKKYGYLRFKAPSYFYLYGDSSVAAVTGPGSSTNLGIVRWNGTTGTVVQDTPQVLIDANGVLTLTGTTENIMTLTTNFGSGASSNMVYIEATNALYDRPMLRIIDSSNAGGCANIRIDSPNPDIELVESDQVSPAGKFEIAVQGDILQLNGRNAADSSFEVAIGITRKGATTNPGSMVIGAATGDRPNAMLETVVVSTQAYLMCSSAVGASSGDVFNIDTNGNLVFNDRGNAVSARFESDTDANNLFLDGTNNKVLIGMNSGGLQKLHVKGRAQLGLANNTSGTLDLSNSAAAGLTRLAPGAPAVDVTMTFPITSGTVALTSGNASLSASRFVGGSGTPGTTAGTGAGTSPTLVSVTGNDAAGIINITTGTTPAGTNAIIVTVTFNTTYSSAPVVVLTPGNRNAQALATTSQPLVPVAGQTNGVTTTTFVLESGSVGLTAATAYKWVYHVIN